MVLNQWFAPWETRADCRQPSDKSRGTRIAYCTLIPIFSIGLLVNAELAPHTFGLYSIFCAAL